MSEHLDCWLEVIAWVLDGLGSASGLEPKKGSANSSGLFELCGAFVLGAATAIGWALKALCKCFGGRRG